MEYDKIFSRKEGPLMVTTKKDDTGAIVIVSIRHNRNKNIDYNEGENTLKGEDNND